MALYFASATQHSRYVPSPLLLHADWEFETPKSKGYAPLQDSGLVEFDLGKMKWFLKEGLALKLEEELWEKEEEEAFGSDSGSEYGGDGKKKSKGVKWRKSQWLAKREKRQRKACTRALKAVTEGEVVGKSGVSIIISEAD